MVFEVSGLMGYYDTVCDVISHKREEKHTKKSVGHTKRLTKFIKSTEQTAVQTATCSVFFVFIFLK